MLSNTGDRVRVCLSWTCCDREQAEQLVKTYASGEANILQQDFFNSLLAAYHPDEVRLQLQQQGIDQLEIEVVSDRHFIVSGRL